MKKVINFLLLLIIVIIFNNTAQGQALFEPYKLTPLTTQPSPAARAQSKYLGYPVSNATGLINISVPIYNVSIKNIDFPLQLSYHSSGIKIQDYPGIIGYGWTLQPGFRISRTIMGKPDEHNPPVSNPHKALETMSKENLYQTAMPPTGQADRGWSDFQYDLFTIQLPNISASFILLYENNVYTVKMLSQKPIIITPLIYSEGKAIKLYGFNVTDEYGTNYIFGEDSDVAKYPKDPNTYKYLELDTQDDEAPVGWMLKYANNILGETIFFEYETNNEYNDVRSEYWTLTDQGQVRSDSDTDYKYTYSFQALTGSSGYSYTLGIMPSANINIKNTRSLSKISTYSEVIQFKYKDGYERPYKYSELILDSIIIYPRTNTIEENNIAPTKAVKFINKSPGFLTGINISDEGRYQFIYNEQTDQFSHKAIDWWGYYNGKTQNENSLPKIALTAVSTDPRNPTSPKTEIFNIGKADREPDSVSMKAKSLEKIIYPTGGFLKINTEPHIVGGKIIGGLRVSSTELYDPVSQKTVREQYIYEKAHYTAAEYPNGNDFIQMKTLCGTIGGSDGYMGIAAFITARSRTLSQFSPYTAFFDSSCEVWYSQVTKISNDSKTVLTYEYTPDIRDLRISVHGYYYNIINRFVYTEPKLTNEYFYKKTGSIYSLVKRVENKYFTTKRNPTKSVILIPEKILTYGQNTGHGNLAFLFEDYYVGTIDPYFPGGPTLIGTDYDITEGEVQLISSTETNYTDYGNVTSSTIFQYDKLRPYNLIQKNTSTSGSREYVEKYYYSSDTIPDIDQLSINQKKSVKLMNENNFLTTPIQKVLEIDQKRIYSVLYGYQNYRPFLTETIYYQYKGLFEKRISYDNYNPFGQPGMVTMDETNNVIYIWNLKSLLAEIKNATYSDVVDKLGQPLIDRLNSATIPSDADLKKVNDLRDVLPLAQVSTYTYKPLVGMLTSTDPFGLTTYYEYDGFGRLKRTYLKEDNKPKNIQTFEYHYANGDIPKPDPEELEPDAYPSAKELKKQVYLTIPTWTTGGWGLSDWDYDKDVKTDGRPLISKTYKTVDIDEYEWTAENLKLKYWNLWSTYYNWMNITQSDVNYYLTTSLHPTIPLKEFENIFGTWVTSYPEASTYRTQVKVYDKEGGIQIPGWKLPSKAALEQLYGQAPRTSGRVYEDIKDFLFASACDNSYDWGYNMFNRKNISGLTLTPLGMRQNKDGGSRYGFGEVAALQTDQALKPEIFSDILLTDVQPGIYEGTGLYQFTQARYSREKTAQELGYKLYIDQANDQVLMLPYNEQLSLPELPKGMERGIALRYANREHMYILKSWSAIQAEAVEIRAGLRLASKPVPLPSQPCGIQPDPFVKGQESTTYMTVPTAQDWAWGFGSWDYDKNVKPAKNQITKTYKTRRIGEYEWTTENLLLKNIDYSIYIPYAWINITQAEVNSYLGHSNTALTDFEKVFGNWASEFQTGFAYRTFYKFYDKENGTLQTGWDLPTANDISYLVGLAPATSSKPWDNLKDFLFASPAENTLGLPWSMMNRKNTSGLTLTPLGMKPNVKNSTPYGFGQVTALKSKTSGYVHIFTDMSLSGSKIGLLLDNYNYHLTQVRYCRKLSDAELGYKMYIDETYDRVLMLPYDQVSALPELTMGIERGVALRYANKASLKVLRKWSQIKAEAADIKSKI